jgi:WD40 repeat protein
MSHAVAAMLLLGTLATRCAAMGAGPDAPTVIRRTLENPPAGKLFVAISRDGRRVLAGGEDGRLACWEAESGRLLWIVEGHQAFINSVALSPDGARAASGGPARAVEVAGAAQVVGRLEGAVVHTWDAEAGRRVATIEPASIPDDLAFDRSGSRLVSVHPGSDPAVWDATTGEPLAILGRSGVPSRAFTDQVQQRTDIDPNARHTASLERSIGAIESWDLPVGRASATDYDPASWPPACVALDGTGTVAATLDLRQSPSLYDLEASTMVANRPPAASGDRLDHPVSLAFGPEGRLLVSGDVGGTVRIWDLDSDKPPRVVEGPDGHVRALAFVSGGAVIRVVSGGWLVPRDGPAAFEPIVVWEIDLDE